MTKTSMIEAEPVEGLTNGDTRRLIMRLSPCESELSKEFPRLRPGQANVELVKVGGEI